MYAYVLVPVPCSRRSILYIHTYITCPSHKCNRMCRLGYYKANIPPPCLTGTSLQRCVSCREREEYTAMIKIMRPQHMYVVTLSRQTTIFDWHSRSSSCEHFDPCIRIWNICKHIAKKSWHVRYLTLISLGVLLTFEVELRVAVKKWASLIVDKEGRWRTNIKTSTMARKQTTNQIRTSLVDVMICGPCHDHH